MTSKQRTYYRGTLWPAACKAKGWNPKDEGQRQRFNLQTVGEESTSAMDQDQITLLFDELRFLADGSQDFDKAMLTADPAQGWQANKRRQLIWRIETAAKARNLSPHYLDTAARGKCATHNAARWQELPLPELLKFSYTVHSRGTTPSKDSAPLVQDTCTENAGPSLIERTRARLARKTAQTDDKTPVLAV